MAETRHGYTIIPGSAALRSNKDVAEQLDVLETNDGAFHDEVRGEELYSCEPVGLPEAVFTHLLPRQKPLEQLVYLHLLQRSLSSGRNFCRVSRAQLAAGVRSSYDGQCKHTWLEALRASSAAPYFFDEYVLGEGDEEMRFQDGAIVANNPCVLALQEAQCLWPGRPVDVVVSVGTGR